MFTDNFDSCLPDNTEDVLKRAVIEEKYKILFNSLSDAIYIHEVVDDIDVISRFVEVNDIACKRMGYTRDELIGCSVLKINHIDCYGAKVRHINNVIKNGRSVYETIHLTKDGTNIPEEVSSHYIHANNRKFILSVARDITERKKAEKKIRESEAKYYSLFMNMKSGVCYNRIILDDTGKAIDFEYIEVNETFSNMVGLKKDDIAGKRFLELFPEFEQKFEYELNSFSEVALKGLNIVNDEYYDKIFHRWYSASLYSPEKYYFVVITNDITNKKIAEENMKKAIAEAEAANKAKSEFFANMSHEIRTPINGIVGMIDLTLLTDMSREQKENLIIAKNCAGSLMNIINDILDFSKMEAGKLKIDHVNFNIVEMFDEIVKTQSLAANGKGLSLTHIFSTDIPCYLVGDPNRLKQVLYNLVSNAVKFTEKGEIIISARKAAELINKIEIEFSVSDTGIGISHENMGRLFRSFSQIDSSYTKKTSGTGLGLAISKKLVEMMGGLMWVESELGKGSTFYFKLAFELGGRPAEKELIDNVSLRPVQHVNILLVEDDNVNRLMLSRILIEKGYNVEVATNGMEALEACKGRMYDLILMDIQMPEMDGIETCKKIHEAEGPDRHTPVIALTAFALTGDRERFIEAGMDEYIAKPMKIEELFAMIQKVINMRKENDFYETAKLTMDGELKLADPLESKADSVIKSKEEMKELLAGVDECFVKLEQVLSSYDPGVIETAAHMVKEYFDRIGAEELKRTAFRIELAARRGDSTQIINYSTQLKSEFETYKKSFNF